MRYIIYAEKPIRFICKGLPLEIPKTFKTRKNVHIIHYNNQINARTLIDQSAVGYCAVKPMENHASSELLYKSNRPQVSIGYSLINYLGCW